MNESHDTLSPANTLEEVRALRVDIVKAIRKHTGLKVKSHKVDDMIASVISERMSLEDWCSLTGMIEGSDASDMHGSVVDHLARRSRSHLSRVLETECPEVDRVRARWNVFNTEES